MVMLVMLEAIICKAHQKVIPVRPVYHAQARQIHAVRQVHLLNAQVAPVARHLAQHRLIRVAQPLPFHALPHHALKLLTPVMPARLPGVR